MKKGIDFKNAKDVEWEEMFKAHPVRFIICVPFWLLALKVFLMFCTSPISVEAFIILIIKLAFLSFVTWLGYGPINLHNLRRQKELKIVADYIREERQAEESIVGDELNYRTDKESAEQDDLNKIWTPEERIRKQSASVNYCFECGRQLKINWKSCPYCGSDIKM